MANQLSLSGAQVRALDKMFEKHVRDRSLDDLAAEYGTEEAFRLHSLAERVKDKSDDK